MFITLSSGSANFYSHTHTHTRIMYVCVCVCMDGWIDNVSKSSESEWKEYGSSLYLSTFLRVWNKKYEGELLPLMLPKQNKAKPSINWIIRYLW